jgi:phosphopantothenoylcysteine decarboxylase/phosphopantothenate--cysteine ligase
VLPLACITCGPAFEPIDKVRRLTNFSTGEIGTVLAETFLREGFKVICFRSETATFRSPEGVDVRSFSTNASLAAGLRSLECAPDAVFHAAALCDFVLDRIEGAEGSEKLSSRSGSIRLTLKPTEKILPMIRDWFPKARVTGWKFELDGTRDQAIARAKAQIQEARSDACVLNGAAYGPGFGVMTPDSRIQHFPDKLALAAGLAEMEKCFSRNLEAGKLG